MVGEILLLFYALFAAALMMRHDGWLSVPFMLLYAASFGAVVTVGLWQHYDARRTLPTRKGGPGLAAANAGDEAMKVDPGRPAYEA